MKTNNKQNGKENNDKKLDREIIRKLFYTSLASVLLGILGYIVAVKLFPVFSRATYGEENWNLLEGFASLISLVLIAGGLTFAIAEYVGKEREKLKAQLAEEREENKLSYEIYQAIFKKLTDPEQEAARRWILAEIDEKGKDEDLASWYEKTNRKIMANAAGDDIPEGQKSIKLTLNCFDYIGFIADHFWDADEDSLDWISAPIAKVWNRIGPYVEYVGELRGVEDYYTSARSIGNRCVEWRKEKGWDKEDYAENTP